MQILGRVLRTQPTVNASCTIYICIRHATFIANIFTPCRSNCVLICVLAPSKSRQPSPGPIQSAIFNHDSSRTLSSRRLEERTRSIISILLDKRWSGNKTRTARGTGGRGGVPWACSCRSRCCSTSHFPFVGEGTKFRGHPAKSHPGAATVVVSYDGAQSRARNGHLLPP